MRTLRIACPRRRAVIALSFYEIKKNIHKFVVLTLIVLTFMAVFASILVINFIKTNPDISKSPVGSLIRKTIERYEWILTLLLPRFFIVLIAIVIGAGLFSSEYEEGTSYIIYTRPLSRLDMYLGKFLGGFTLLSVLIFSYAFLGIWLSTVFFGKIEGWQAIPFVVIGMIYSQLMFYSISYMFGQLFRRSTLSLLVSMAVLLIFSAIQGVLEVLASLRGLEYLKNVVYVLPTWAANLPLYISIELLPEVGVFMGRMGTFISDVWVASLVILLYFLFSTTVTLYSLHESDLAS